MMKYSNCNIFAKNKCTLREASCDQTNQEYMLESEISVVNFDKVKREYVNTFKCSENLATSVDALIFLADRDLFIEFKNGVVNNRDLRDKARDSLLIFLDIVKEDLSYSRENVQYIVVYNYEKNTVKAQDLKQKNIDIQESPSKDEIAHYFMHKAKQPFIRFGLDGYQKVYFKDVLTLPKERFVDYLKELHLN